MVIYLGCWLPNSSSGLPGDDWESGTSRLIETSLLLDLAQHGGCLANALLHPTVVSYTTISPLLFKKEERYTFCGPCPNAFTLPGVTRHAALLCADFPRAHCTRDHPASLLYYLISLYSFYIGKMLLIRQMESYLLNYL